MRYTSFHDGEMDVEDTEARLLDELARMVEFDAEFQAEEAADDHGQGRRQLLRLQEVPVSKTFPLTTGDPQFDPKERVTVNGYEYVPAAEYERIVAAAKTALEDQVIAAYERAKSFKEGKDLLERVSVAARRGGLTDATDLQRAVRPGECQGDRLVRWDWVQYGFDTGHGPSIGYRSFRDPVTGNLVHEQVRESDFHNEPTDG